MIDSSNREAALQRQREELYALHFGVHFFHTIMYRPIYVVDRIDPKEIAVL